MEHAESERLIICKYKTAPHFAEALRKLFIEKIPMPPELQAVREKHIIHLNMLNEKGLIWAGGPSSDYNDGFIIFNLDSVEEVKKEIRSDPNYINHYWYDDEYYQWIVHISLSKYNHLHNSNNST